jgi:uncharacterized protein with von Willebrand factor type A (vWA) domain
MDTRKRYHMVQCPCTWTIFGIYEDLDEAILSVLCTPLRYDAKFDRSFSGYYYEFQKGFFQNISVWEILSALSKEISDNRRRLLDGSYDADAREAARMEVLFYPYIDQKMQPYKDYVWSSANEPDNE